MGALERWFDHDGGLVRGRFCLVDVADLRGFGSSGLSDAQARILKHPSSRFHPLTFRLEGVVYRHMHLVPQSKPGFGVDANSWRMTAIYRVVMMLPRSGGGGAAFP